MNCIGDGKDTADEWPKPWYHAKSMVLKQPPTILNWWITLIFFWQITFWATWKFLWSIWALQRIAHSGGVLGWILPSCSKHHHVFRCTQHCKWLRKVRNYLWLLPPIRNACFTHHPSHSKIYYTSLSWRQCIFGLIILLCMPLLKCTRMNVVKICHPS